MNKQKLYGFAFLGLLTLNVRGEPFTKNASPEGIKVRERIEQKVDQKRDTVAILKEVKVTAKDAASVTVDNNGTSVKVNVMSSTQFRRKFWGKSDLDEISVNDLISVIGKWTDDTKTTIDARLIRNLSVQKRYGVFFGEIKALNGDTFVMTTINREDQTVTIGTAKLINRRQQVISQADLIVGHRVRVRGLWDNVNKTITEVKEIKDFSLPPKPSPVPTATQ